VSDKLLAEERKKNNKVTRRTEIDNTCKEQHPHLVERDKPNKSESVGQTLQLLPWKQKREDINIEIFSFLNF
jgi:hypothetical protein